MHAWFDMQTLRECPYCKHDGIFTTDVSVHWNNTLNYVASKTETWKNDSKLRFRASAEKLPLSAGRGASWSHTLCRAYCPSEQDSLHSKCKTQMQTCIMYERASVHLQCECTMLKVFMTYCDVNNVPRHTYVCTYLHPHTHTSSHTHTQTHMRAHTHTHSCLLAANYSLRFHWASKNTYSIISVLKGGSQ